MHELYNKKNKLYNAIVLLMAYITTLAATIQLLNFDEREIRQLEATGNIVKRYILQIRFSINEYSIVNFFVFITIAYFYHLLLRYKYDSRLKIVTLLIAAFIGIFNVLGYVFYKENSWDAIFGSKFGMLKGFICILGIGIAFYNLILCLYKFVLPKISNIKSKECNFLEGNRKTILFVFLIILIAWIPYYFILYPGSLMHDGRDQIAQVLNDYQYSGSAKRLELLNENVILNAHHPVVYTLYLGIFVKLGQFLNNMTLGIGLFTLSQAIISALIIAISVYLMAKLNFSKIVIKITIAFFALWPMNPLYIMTITKDYFFSLMSLLCTIAFYSLVKKPHLFKNYKFMIFVFLSLLGLQLTKSNGKYMVMFMMVLVLIAFKHNKLQVLITLIIPYVIYSLLIVKIIFPAFDITVEGSKRAIMYLPQQQVVRCLIEHPDKITEEEKEAISKVFRCDGDMSVLTSRYNPIRCTKVMEKYNYKASTEELKEFFKCWLGMLKKYPGTCLEATLNQDYRMFYMAPIGIKYYTKVLENPYDIKENESTEVLRNGLRTILDTLEEFPIVSIFLNMAFYTWIIIIAIGYFLARKQYFNIIPLGFCIANMLLSLIGPLIQIRYTIQWSICVPFIIGMVVKATKEEQVIKIFTKKDKETEDEINNSNTLLQ